MKLPFTIRTMKRGGKYRRCVIKYNQWPNGDCLDTGRIVFVYL